jgi:hypothetical protein
MIAQGKVRLRSARSYMTHTAVDTLGISFRNNRSCQGPFTQDFRRIFMDDFLYPSVRGPASLGARIIWEDET